MADNEKPKTLRARFYALIAWTAKALAATAIASFIGTLISDHYTEKRARIEAFQRLAGLRYQVTTKWKGAGCSDSEFYVALNEAVVIFNYSEDIRKALGLLDDKGISDTDALPFALSKIALELKLGPIDTATLRQPLAPTKVTC